MASEGKNAVGEVYKKRKKMALMKDKEEGNGLRKFVTTPHLCVYLILKKQNNRGLAVSTKV